MTPGLNPPQKIPDPVGVAQHNLRLGYVRSLQDHSSGGGTYPGVSLRATTGYDLRPILGQAAGPRNFCRTESFS